MQVDEYDVPAIKLTIHDAEVLWNPFDDLQPRVDKEEKKAAREEAEALAKVRQELCMSPQVSCDVLSLDCLPLTEFGDMPKQATCAVCWGCHAWPCPSYPMPVLHSEVCKIETAR